MVEVTLSQIGAGVYSVFYKGEVMNAGPMNKDAYITDRVSFYGKTIAPFAGRLKDGLFSIGEKEFHLPLTVPDSHSHPTAHGDTWQCPYCIVSAVHPHLNPEPR